MGYNTTVVVLNDALQQIEEDKDFGKNLVAAIKQLRIGGGGDPITVGAGNHANPVVVIETHHADSLNAILVGGNTAQDLGYVGGYRLDPKTTEGKEALLRSLAFSFGYNIALRRRKRG